jgi:NAD(P)-dependent dehydrogenase (short-subunit alcohol dehydrogenase family)
LLTYDTYYTSSQDVYDQFNTNVLGTIKVTRAVLPHQRARSSGVIINFGSLGSWESVPAYALYCATKATISNLSEGLYDEVRPFGINVCVIEPGYFRTGFLRSGHKVGAAVLIPEYEASVVGECRRAVGDLSGKQPGNVLKAAPIIVDAMTQTGVAAGKDIPKKLVLGSDIIKVIQKRMKDTANMLEEWGSISSSTDY